MEYDKENIEMEISINVPRNGSSDGRTLDQESPTEVASRDEGVASQMVTHDLQLDILNKPPDSMDHQMIQNSKKIHDTTNASIIGVKPNDRLTFQRLPVIVTPDFIRCTVGFAAGRHCWEVHWPTNARTSNAMVGVAARQAPLRHRCYGFAGCVYKSWGWDLGANRLFCDFSEIPGDKYPNFGKPEEIFKVPDRFLVVLDMNQGTLGFVAGGKNLGVAFRDLGGLKLYPIISADGEGCVVNVTYWGNLESGPPPLKDLCRNVVCQSLGTEEIEEKLKSLCIPKTLNNYLLYKD